MIYKAHVDTYFRYILVFRACERKCDTEIGVKEKDNKKEHVAQKKKHVLNKFYFNLNTQTR